MTAIIEVIRGTPLLVQLFILYYGLSATRRNLNIALHGGDYQFLLSTAAVNRPNTRGSQSIAAVQMKAARSLGMTKRQAILQVIMPQAPEESSRLGQMNYLPAEVRRHFIGLYSWCA